MIILSYQGLNDVSSFTGTFWKWLHSTFGCTHLYINNPSNTVHNFYDTWS